jgi:hypothetical protein
MRRLVGWGVTLVLVGLWIWLSALNVPYMVFRRDWPLLIVAAGISMVVRRIRRAARRRRSSAQVISDLESGKIDADKAVIEIRRSR